MKQTRKEKWAEADSLLTKVEAQSDEIRKQVEALLQMQQYQAIIITKYNKLIDELGRR